MRNPSINILKGLAIIFVVLAQSGCPASLSTFCYMVCCSLFFVSSGYCFKVSYLKEPGNFVARRFRRLYVPFVTWSVLFLALNPLLFATGLLNEQYGRVAGEVAHPLDLHQWLQNLWSIVFNMSGYDQFLCDAYWFFRALLVSSIAFIVCFILVRRIPFFSRKNILNALVVALLALCLALWQTSDGLRITGLDQGGYRELMGVFFIAIGFFCHEFGHKIKALSESDEDDSEDLPMWVHAISLTLGVVVLYAILKYSSPAMRVSETSLTNVLFLAISGLASFTTVYSLSFILSRASVISRTLSYIGNCSIYILGFHLLAFKLVSMIEIAAYDLPWLMVGCHPVVNNPECSWFWILYTLAGVGLPLLFYWIIRYCAVHYDIHSYTRFACFVGSHVWSVLRACGRLIAASAVWIATNGWRGILYGIVSAWEGIYNFCIRFVDTVKDSADVHQDDGDDEEDEYDEDDEDEEYEDDEEEDDENEDR